MGKDDKLKHVLSIYDRLMNGYTISKREEADRFGVSGKTVQRYLAVVRNYLADESERTGVINQVTYDRNLGGYRLERLDRIKFTNSEVLAVCKILLDSRAFTKAEMDTMLHKLAECCVPGANRKLVMDLIANEAFHYIEPRHRTVFLNTMWEAAQAIHKHRYITIKYQRLKGQALVERRLMPAAIMFSGFYFYLAAFIDEEETRTHFDVINDSFPTIYRIDRIQELKVMDEHFQVPDKDRFKEGEFRKRVQFMYGGKLQQVKFRYTGPSLEAVLDRLPTAEVVCEDAQGWTVKAEVFGTGIEMWFRSQGSYVTKIG